MFRRRYSCGRRRRPSGTDVLRHVKHLKQLDANSPYRCDSRLRGYGIQYCFHIFYTAGEKEANVSDLLSDEGEVLFKVRRYYLSVVHHNIQLDKPRRTRRGIRFLKGNTKKTVKYTPTWHINLIIYWLFTHLCAFTTHLHTLKWNKGTIKEDHSSANKNVSEWIQVLHSKYIYTEVLTDFIGVTPSIWRNLTINGVSATRWSSGRAELLADGVETDRVSLSAEQTLK